MILPDFYLPSRANTTWRYSGIDSPDQCRNWRHFDSYPYSIEYQFNSRGYRDTEWPEDIQELKKRIWCIGDSFTVGLGAPVEHTWPYLLGKSHPSGTINISMDGASNDWIARRALDIVSAIAPEWIVVQWSYIERRESDDVSLTDEQRRLWHVVGEREGIDNLIHNINKLEQQNITKVIHSTIPNFTNNQVGQQLLLKKHSKYSIPHFENLDLARDGWHYDIKTATMVTEKVLQLITT